MKERDGMIRGDANDRKTRLHRLTELFAPHVRDYVAKEARKRTLFLPLGLIETVAMAELPVPDATVASIVERALAGEARMIVREWTLLIVEHANDHGRTLRLSALDDAMLPPFGDDLARIFIECCGRRMAPPLLTRCILASVRAALPEGQALPAEAVAFVRGHGIDVVA